MADQKELLRVGAAVRRDERLIDLFLRGCEDRDGKTYHLQERPDQVERG